MSGKIMGQVYDLDLPANQQAVLLAYADHADHEGRNVHPSEELIAYKTGYSADNVERIRRQLVKDGLMVAVENTRGGRGRFQVYEIHCENGKKKPPFDEVYPNARENRKRGKTPRFSTTGSGSNAKGSDSDDCNRKGSKMPPFAAAGGGETTASCHGNTVDMDSGCTGLDSERVADPDQKGCNTRGDYRGASRSESPMEPSGIEPSGDSGAAAPPASRDFGKEYIDRWRLKYPNRQDQSAPHLRGQDFKALRELFDVTLHGDMEIYCRVLDGFFGTTSAWLTDGAYSVRCLCADMPERWLRGVSPVSKSGNTGSPPSTSAAPARFDRETLERQGLVPPTPRGLDE